MNQSLNQKVHNLRRAHERDGEEIKRLEEILEIQNKMADKLRNAGIHVVIDFTGDMIGGAPPYIMIEYEGETLLELLGVDSDFAFTTLPPEPAEKKSEDSE